MACRGRSDNFGPVAAAGSASRFSTTARGISRACCETSPDRHGAKAGAAHCCKLLLHSSGVYELLRQCFNAVCLKVGCKCNVAGACGVPVLFRRLRDDRQFRMMQTDGKRRTP